MQVKSMLQKESMLERIAGPYPTPPLDNFIVSPLGCIPKKESGKFRIIHDLSSPRGNSINDFISEEDASVQYETFDTLVSLVQHYGKGCLMAKTDIEEAFRIIPIHPSDRHLLGFSFENEFFYDKCLPMGCRSSCAIFESVSRAIQHIIQGKFPLSGVTHILDDFIFVGPSQQPNTQETLHGFLQFAQEIGLPIKDSKTVLPTTTIIAHGIEIDSVKMTARLPQDKIERAKLLLHQFKSRRKVTLKEIQSLIGTLNFACRVIRPGRAFLRRLINLTCKSTQSHHHIKLNADARADINAWLIFLSSFNGVSVLLKNQFASSDALKLFSDASGSVGYAAVCGSNWLQGAWPPSWKEIHITPKELFPIVLALEIWGKTIANQKVLFKTDNMAVAEIINKQSCKDSFTMKLVRRLVIAALQHNILFRAVHIAGYTNLIPDHLSRSKFQEALQLAPWLNRTPTPIPHDLI